MGGSGLHFCEHLIVFVIEMSRHMWRIARDALCFGLLGVCGGACLDPLFEGGTNTLESTVPLESPRAPALCGRLGVGEGLLARQSLSSCDGRYSLEMQDNGNLALCANDGGCLWASRTGPRGTSNGQFAAIMQEDGNFVVFELSTYRGLLRGVRKWDSATNGHPEASLELQNDGNVVVYDVSDIPLWASDLARKGKGPSNTPFIPSVLWHNGITGSTEVWYLRDAARIGSARVDSSFSVIDDTGWTPVGINDFDGDGFSDDIIWHNGAIGVMQVWYMNSGTRSFAEDFSPSLNVPDGTGWRVVGTNDFDRDGRADILWHNGLSGATQLWCMTGIVRDRFINFDPALNVYDDSGWRVVGTNDFNHDGRTDILWHEGVSGAMQVWYMAPITPMTTLLKRDSVESFDSSLNLPDISGWAIVEMDDFNQDSRPDILWHNGASGQLRLWYMDGTRRIGSADFDSALSFADSTGWRIVGR